MGLMTSEEYEDIDDQSGIVYDKVRSEVKSNANKTVISIDNEAEPAGESGVAKNTDKAPAQEEAPAPSEQPLPPSEDIPDFMK